MISSFPTRRRLFPELGRTQVSRQPREPIPARGHRASEQGYIMLIAIFFIALLVISLAVAAPKIARSIQRDRDVETFHRGMQYRRAIQLYYRQFHAYPPSVDALVGTNNVRFLRKKYLDPITGQADWKPIAFGQNKTPTAMGFFGQPLAGNASTVAGIGPSGGAAGMPGTTAPGGGGFSSGGFSSGSSSGSNSIFSSSDTSSDQSPSTGGAGSADSSGGGSSATGSTTGTSSGATGGTAGGATGSTGTTSGSSGPTFGGAGVIGFSPASSKASILVYKKKQHYNEWEFTYDPLSDTPTIPGAGGSGGLTGQPGQGTTTGGPGLGGSPGIGGGPGIGSGPGIGGPPSGGNNPGANMPPETTPQQ
jgi:type II secretory pathway pseudopilin PulG